MAGKAFSAAAQPVRQARGPTSTLSPIVAGLPRTPRITAVSMTTQLAPSTTGPLSAVSTAPKPMEQFGPAVTSPHTVAFGATRAVGSMTGAAPPCVRIIAMPRPTRQPRTGRDVR